jgi:CRP/FNR family transcriptional regulator
MKKVVVAGQPDTQPCANCAVRPHAICAALERDELRQLGQRLQYRPGEPVFTQEEIATSCYNLLEGVMRLYKLLPDGRRQIVGFALPGDFLGISVNGRHGISADAVGPVVFCRFVKKSFSRFVEDRPNLLRRINEFAARDLTEAQAQMVLLGRRSAEEKVATFLVKWARSADADRPSHRDHAVADEPAGHRRLPWSHHRNGQPHLYQARARRGDRDRAWRHSPGRCRARGSRGRCLNLALRFICPCRFDRHQRRPRRVRHTAW